jgi:hypothetical protein
LVSCMMTQRVGCSLGLPTVNCPAQVIDKDRQQILFACDSGWLVREIKRVACNTGRGRWRSFAEMIR